MFFCYFVVLLLLSFPSNLFWSAPENRHSRESYVLLLLYSRHVVYDFFFLRFLHFGCCVVQTKDVHENQFVEAASFKLNFWARKWVNVECVRVYDEARVSININTCVSMHVIGSMRCLWISHFSFLSQIFSLTSVARTPYEIWISWFLLCVMSAHTYIDHVSIINFRSKNVLVDFPFAALYVFTIMMMCLKSMKIIPLLLRLFLRLLYHKKNVFNWRIDFMVQDWDEKKHECIVSIYGPCRLIYSLFSSNFLWGWSKALWAERTVKHRFLCT